MLPDFTLAEREALRRVLHSIGLEADDVRYMLSAVRSARKGGGDEVVGLDHPLTDEMVTKLRALGFKAEKADLNKGGIMAQARVYATPNVHPEGSLGSPTPSQSPPSPTPPPPPKQRRGSVYKAMVRNKGKALVLPGVGDPLPGPNDPFRFTEGSSKSPPPFQGARNYSPQVGDSESFWPKPSALEDLAVAKVPMPQPGLLSRGISRLGSFVKANPGTAAIDAIGFGLPLLGMAKDAVNWGSRQVTGDPLIGRELTVEQSLEMEKKVRMEQMRLQIQQQERAKVLTSNTINLLQYAPDVARQVMAGRRLPKGAVVIGGAPRVDLMQEVAGQMADGAYQEQDPLTQLTSMMR